MKLYGFWRSGNTRKVRLCLAEVGVDYQWQSVDLPTGEQRKPNYLSLNPNGTVPTLEDGDLVLWESSAILLYLAEKFPRARLMPQSLTARARVYKWMVWQPATFNPPRQRLVAELSKPPSVQDVQAIATLRSTIAHNLETLAAALGNNAYLIDGRYTLADVVMLPHLAALRDSCLALPTTVNRYLDVLAMRPAWLSTVALKE